MRNPGAAILIALPLAVLLLAAAPLSRAQEAEEERPDWGYTDLDQVRFGIQLRGPTLSHYDLRGRIVICFHWGITCPMSTGMFPAMNRLLERYRDRGVVVIAFQVRRDPDVLENNVVWYLEHLAPDFPACRLGQDWDWPAKYLPWAHVFDQRGDRIFSGNLSGIEKILDEALTDAPDFLVGGPYEKLADLAAEIAADRESVGRRLPEIRKIAAREGGDPKERAEAREMVARIEEYFAWQTAKAEEDVNGVVEEAEVYRRLSEMYEGDALGARAAGRLEEIRSAPRFATEEGGHRALARARIAFRRLPPAGRYAYNMDYSEIEDRPVLATRSRMIAEFRSELSRIIRAHPETRASSVAEDLLFEHGIPEIDGTGARGRVEQAERMLKGPRTPFELHDAGLLLTEVVEGYFEVDETAERAGRLFASIGGEKPEKLDDAAAAYRSLTGEESDIREQVRQGGGALPKAEAVALIRRLAGVAKKAGRESRLALRANGFIRRLEKSFEGPAKLGVVFDDRYGGPGARIRWVYPRTAAAKHGLRPGDVIATFEGMAVENAVALTRAVAAFRPGRTVELAFRRGADAAGEGGATETVKVVLGRKE